MPGTAPPPLGCSDAPRSPALPVCGGTLRPARPFRPPGPSVTTNPPGGERDAFFDNAKYLALVLMAVSHFWEVLPDPDRVLRGLRGLRGLH